MTKPILPSPAILFIAFTLLGIGAANAQIPGPGAERERALLQQQMERPVIDRDSVTIRDTSIVFDPSTYEQTVTIFVNRWSLRDYCRIRLGMNNPEILLDYKPHVIVDPRTYDEMTIRLRPEGKIDTIPN
jgi:hypothetical protein